MTIRWEDVTFIGVYWNDPDRVANLLAAMRPWFRSMVVGVQHEPGDLETLYAAQDWADRVIEDEVHGYCEPTIGKVLNQVRTEWSFLVSADEMPSDGLLASFQDMVDIANGLDGVRLDGWWVKFHSVIDGVEYPSEQDNHLRFFRTHLGWPKTMHSRPPASSADFWKRGVILHDRSLDEMMQDYLRYHRLGSVNPDWVAHNTVMMHDACEATAARKGWEYVRSFPWWPNVAAIAFKET